MLLLKNNKGKSVIIMERRRNTVIQRAILRTLGEKGPMTAGTLAKEVGATYRTVKRHLYILERFKGKIEWITFYPDITLCRLRKKQRMIQCQRCRAKVTIPE
ncbi:MAG: helix-turn-helix transcriptional regulator [Euryarchaeota archaeon]|nr:helix-turn-helix transcriptional regulator [Euryarchaeota archaeon]